jgi:hypothetical protein
VVKFYRFLDAERLMKFLKRHNEATRNTIFKDGAGHILKYANLLLDRDTVNEEGVAHLSGIPTDDDGLGKLNPESTH